MAIKKEAPEQDMVPVYIPKKSRDDTERFVAVNGRRMLIQTGVQVMLPREFAEVIEASFEADRAAQRYIESVESK